MSVPVPDLGNIRYYDPLGPRELWLGLDVGGVYLPRSLAPVNTDVSTLGVRGSWALRLGPRLSAGGRHGVVLYEARGSRLQVQEHQLELSARLLPWPLTDRLALGVEFHELDRTWVDGRVFAIGGVGDRIFSLGYGLSQRASRLLLVAWNVQARWVDVFRDTQRQVRASLRPTLSLPMNHALSVEAVAYLVHRDANQFGRDIPRTTLHGQLALAHTWMSGAGIGSFAELRYMTGFLSGQAPMYEVRPEALQSEYGEVQTGVRVAW